MKYLLGDLPEAEREMIEQQYFVNQEVWETLAQVETELIDSYVRGSLTQHEDECFERYFLASPQKRKRVELAKMLMDQDRNTI